MLRRSVLNLLVIVTVAASLSGCESMRAARRRALQGTITARHSLPGQRPPSTPAARAAEELWIVARNGEPGSLAGAAGASAPGALPSLRAVAEGAGGATTLQPKGVAVHAGIAGPAAEVAIRQQYENPFDHSVEVEYVFPLPANAMVTDFVLSIGTRHIRGLIREHGEAQRIYEEAKRAGHLASLLTQERPNTFTQTVANLAADEEIEVETTYFTPLGYRDAEYQLLVPLAAEPGEAPVAPLRLEADIDAGMAIESVYSPSHAIEVEPIGEGRARFAVDADGRFNRRPFELRYKTAGEQTRTGFLAHSDPRGRFFTLILQPPSSEPQPTLTDIHIDWGVLEVTEVYPNPIPDVTDGRPLILTGRFRRATPTTIRIDAQSGSDRQSYEHTVSVADLVENHPTLAIQWLRGRLQQPGAPVTDVAFEYGLASPRSGFLAVDASAREAAEQ